MLAPRDSRSRDCRRLDGLWRFRFDTGGEGEAGRWWQGPLPGAREMAVPASYNDLVTEAAEREHVGDVWYQRDVRVPATWQDRRIVLRCDAATHHGTVVDRAPNEHHQPNRTKEREEHPGKRIEFPEPRAKCDEDPNRNAEENNPAAERPFDQKPELRLALRK